LPKEPSIHLSQEFVAPGLLAFCSELNIRKAELGHDREWQVGDTIQTNNRLMSSMNSGTFSENPLILYFHR